MKKDVKPIFNWARENGDANIYDRILMKVMPSLLKDGIKLTSSVIEESKNIEVSSEIYELIKQKAQELIDRKIEE